MSHQINNDLELYNQGATYVILTHFLGEKYLSKIIEDYQFNIKLFLEKKVRHLNYLNIRKDKKDENSRYQI